jgi:hypothetical protein
MGDFMSGMIEGMFRNGHFRECQLERQGGLRALIFIRAIVVESVTAAT